MKRLLRLGTCLVVAIFVATVTVPTFIAYAALAVPPKPTIPVVDQANVLTAEQITGLTTKINGEATKSSNQIGILIIPSLQGEVLEDYSLKVAREWGIGTKDKNNGVLLLVAIKERQLRMEVGYGLEGALPDLQTHRIITNDITPSFKNGDYYTGIDKGLDGIIASIHNEYKGSAPISPADRPSPEHSSWLNFLFLPILAITWLGSILGRSKSWWAGGVIGGILGGLVGATAIGSVVGSGVAIAGLAATGLLLDYAVSKNYRRRVSNNNNPSWWAGGGFFGGGGNGFGGGGDSGGFGGGGFGGGGSSDSW